MKHPLRKILGAWLVGAVLSLAGCGSSDEGGATPADVAPAADPGPASDPGAPDSPGEGTQREAAPVADPGGELGPDGASGGGDTGSTGGVDGATADTAHDEGGSDDAISDDGAADAPQVGDLGEDAAPSCGLRIDHEPVAHAPLGAIALSARAPGATGVVVRYRRDRPGATWTEMALTASGDGNFNGSIPAGSDTLSDVEYRLETTGGECTGASPAAPAGAAHRVAITATLRLPTAAGVYSYRPDVSGHLVVWSDEGSGRADHTFLLDLRTFETTQLSERPQTQRGARIDGDLVVWPVLVSQQNADLDIQLHDLRDGQIHTVATGPQGQYAPEVEGHIILWREDVPRGISIDGDVAFYDLGADGRFGTADDRGGANLTDHAAEQSAADLSVSVDGAVRVVWDDMRDDANRRCDDPCNRNIYLYDFGPDGVHGTRDDEGPIAVTTHPDSQASPTIDGRWIAWEDERDTGSILRPGIYLYDLGPDERFGTADDGGEAPLPTAAVEVDGLDLSDGLLVWDEYLESSFEVRAFDLLTREVYEITAASRGQFSARVSGRTIVWQDARASTVDDFVDDIWVQRIAPRPTSNGGSADGCPAGFPACECVTKGESRCERSATGDEVVSCNSLYEEVTSACGASDRCVDAGPHGVGCAGGYGTCEGIEAAHGWLLGEAGNTCAQDDDCRVISDQCGVGLGGCYAAVNQAFDEDLLPALGARYMDLGCTRGVCRCAAPPASARCDAGRCVLPTE